MNLFLLAITVLVMVHIHPILSESESRANAFIAAMLPQNGNHNAETMSADDLAESIYQSLIKRKMPPQEQIVHDSERAEEVRAEAEREAVEEAKRKGHARKFLQKMRYANRRRRKLLRMKRLK